MQAALPISPPKHAELNADDLEYARRYARRKAAWLVETVGFPEADREDLEQDLVIEAFKLVPKFVPTRGTLHAFVRATIWAAVGRLLRKHNRRQENCSIQAFEMPELITVAHKEGAVKTYTNDAEHLRVDLDDFLTTLPPRLRELCRRLKTQSWVAALKAMQISRSDEQKLRRELQELFTEAGYSPACLPN